MDLESITKAVEEIVEDIPVTIQINKLTSSYLSVVFSRQKDCAIEYTDLCEKVLGIFKSFEMGEIKSIKFFGKESGESDYEWQYDFTVNANSQNVLPSSSTNYLSKLINSIKTPRDKKISKPLAIGSVVLVLILTGIGGVVYFKNIQYQQAKQAAKQAINQDFIKCENANLNTENNAADISESPEIQKLRNLSIVISKKANDAKIKNTQGSIKVLEKLNSIKDKVNSDVKQLDIQIEDALAKAKLVEIEVLTELSKFRLSGVKLESEVRFMEGLAKKKTLQLELDLQLQKQAQLAKLAEIEKNAEDTKVKGINKLEKELLDIEDLKARQINSINRQIAERQLVEIAEKKKADERKRQKMEDDKKSCQVVEDYKLKYEK